MRLWKPTPADIFKTIAHQIMRRCAWLRATTKRVLHLIRPVRIVPYRGYGNRERLYLMGRVLENKALGSPKKNDAWWQNAAAMLRRFMTDGIPDVRVRMTAGRQAVEATTDAEGYFRADLPLAASVDGADVWRDIEFKLLDRVGDSQDEIRASGAALVPASSSRFGVISDIDDTIIESHATDILRMARITFLNNALTRTPLAGVSRFYRSLERNSEGLAGNPFFYVSSSAWNLYDLFEAFLDLHDIPAGPLLLRNLAFDDRKLVHSGHDHKYGKIEGIMETCSQLPFVLVGDAGQDDAVIYREVVRRRPGRILAIYIRAVGNQRRNERVRRMVAESEEFGVPMVLVDDVEQAIEHAESIGLIVAGTS